MSGAGPTGDFYCPKCGADQTKVTDSRGSLRRSHIRRRRECLKCGHRFSTYETLDHPDVIAERLAAVRKRILALAEALR